MQGLIVSGLGVSTQGSAPSTLDRRRPRLRPWRSIPAIFLAALTAIILAALCSGRASAQTCSATQWPYLLTNGSTADASQVMADLNCAGIYSLANSSLNIGLGVTAPVVKLDVNGVGHFSGACAPSLGNQGAYIGWNALTCGTGETDFINNPGGGPGGFAFILGNPAGTTKTTAAFINSAGYVGVNTIGPNTHLEVDVPFHSTDGISIKSPTDGEFILLLPSMGGSSYNPLTMMGDAGIVYPSQLDIIPWSNTASGIHMNGYGQVGIGTDTPTASLYVNGSTVLTQGYSTTSDARLKTDITPISDALGLVERLRGVRYHWRPVADRAVGKTLALPVNQPQIGFIAQDVQAVAPEAVVAPKDPTKDIYTLQETKLIPILVEAIKEQQAEITKQEAEIAQLRSDLAAQKAAAK